MDLNTSFLKTNNSLKSSIWNIVTKNKIYQMEEKSL